MKNLYKILLSLIVIVGVHSCDDDDISFKINEAAPAFIINAPIGGSTIILDDTTGDNIALTLVWEDTKSSGDVTYTIQFAIADTDFAAPVTVGSTDLTNYDWTVDELNSILLDELQIPINQGSAIEARITATSEEMSNVISLIVTPFIEEVATLFINGSFTDWDPALGLLMNSTEFNIFSLTFDIPDGGEFNFIESNTNSDDPWQLVEAGSLNLTKYGGVNLSGYVAGKYEIVVDLTTNTFTIEQITFPEQLYLVGAGVPDAGWDINSPVEMTLIEEDVFEVTTNFVNDAFRFFTEEGNWGSGLNYPFFIADGYTIDANFEDAQDGDNNFRFIGTPGLYTITVDGINKEITALEIVASSRIAVPGNHQGWDPGSAPQLAASSDTTTDYEGYVWLDGDYKFVGPDGGGNFAWGNTDWADDGTFTGKLVEQDEVNCTAATAGQYFVTADTNSLTYSQTMYNWGLIGDATPGAWGSDQDMTFDQATSTWTITLDLVVGQMKFRANDGWDWNYGTGSDEFLVVNGDNIPVTVDGNYTIVLDLSTPREYTYTMTQN